MKRAHLQGIPQELRDQIYKYMFTPPSGYILVMSVDMNSLPRDAISIRIVSPPRIKPRVIAMTAYQPDQSYNNPSFEDWLTHPIFSTCRQLRWEANVSFWKCSTFHFSMKVIPGSTATGSFYSIPQKVQTSLKSISFDLRLPESPEYISRFKRTMTALNELPKTSGLKTVRLIMSSGELERLTMFRCNNPSQLVGLQGERLDYYRRVYQKFLSLLKFFASCRARARKSKRIQYDCFLQIPHLDDMPLVYTTTKELRDVLLLSAWDETDAEERNKYLLKTFEEFNKILSEDPFKIDDVVVHGDGPRALQIQMMKNTSALIKM